MLLKFCRTESECTDLILFCYIDQLIKLIYRAGLSKKPLDKNAATHLIRNALGGTDYGIDHSKISHLLSLPQDIVRLFRDDITVTVVYFDQEFLRNCPV